MRALPKPADDAQAVFLLCISRVTSVALKGRLISISGDIHAAADIFDACSAAGTAYTLVPEDGVAGVVTTKEMVAVYDQRMARDGAPGRSIYERLLAAPPMETCPLCGQRTVSTLDHHLPKTKFPALAVTPTNLVPACKDCNKAKDARIAGTADEQTLHPYYDDIDGDRWLRAQVVHSSPAALRFSVDPPIAWSAVLTNRVRHHFHVFALADLYASHSGVELTNIRHSLQEIFAAAAGPGVVAHLHGQAVSRQAAQRNSWQTAMYDALYQDHWFCSGGFDL